MSHHKNDSGFSVFELLLVILVAMVVVVVGLLVYRHNELKTLPGDNLPTTSPVTWPNKNGITVYSPSDNSTVGRTFTISGTANKPTSQYDEAIDLIIDGDKNWFYSGFNTNQLAVPTSGKFSLSLNLNGNNVLEERTPTTGGYSYSYKGIPPGKHTFTVNETQSGTVSEIILGIEGPTITLTVN